MSPSEPGVAQEPEQERVDPVAPNAVLWISGLTEETNPQGLERTARRIAVGLDREYPAEMTFTVNTPTGQGADATVSTILQDAGSNAVPVIDLFTLATEEPLVGPLRRKPAWKQSLLGARVVWGATAVLIAKLRGSTGKSTRERLQLLYAIGLVALMSLGLIAIAGGALALLTEDDVKGIPGWAGSIALGVGGFGIWKTRVAKRLRAAALALYAVYQYIERADETGAALRGAVADKLDAIQRHHQGHEYDSITVIAYSFGALVALDACYSPTATPPARLSDIDTLVTVGCPYDLIRAFKPDYAAPRHWLPATPKHWLNFYAPSDVLSSNFRNDALPQQPDVGVLLDAAEPACPVNVPYLIDGRSAPVGPVETLRMKGLKFHGQYWDETNESADTVFVKIVAQLFPYE